MPYLPRACSENRVKLLLQLVDHRQPDIPRGGRSRSPVGKEEAGLPSPPPGPNARLPHPSRPHAVRHFRELVGRFAPRTSRSTPGCCSRLRLESAQGRRRCHSSCRPSLTSYNFRATLVLMPDARCLGPVSPANGVVNPGRRGPAGKSATLPSLPLQPPRILFISSSLNQSLGRGSRQPQGSRAVEWNEMLPSGRAAQAIGRAGGACGRQLSAEHPFVQQPSAARAAIGVDGHNRPGGTPRCSRLIELGVILGLQLNSGSAEPDRVVRARDIEIRYAEWRV